MRIRIRSTILLVLIFTFPNYGFGQAPNSTDIDKLKGKVKSVVNERTYFVYLGRSIFPKKETISLTLLDDNGRVVQESIFGNGEERSTYSWKGNTYNATVTYYDLNGKVSPDLAKSFRPPTDEARQSDLCATYSTARETIPAQKIIREIETCSDRSIRRKTIYELAVNGDLLRMTVEDAKGRSWVHENAFGINFKIIGFRYTVDFLTRPKYWQDITFSNEEFDENKNCIRYMATSTYSDRPGEIIYQYLDDKRITYY